MRTIIAALTALALSLPAAAEEKPMALGALWATSEASVVCA